MIINVDVMRAETKVKVTSNFTSYHRELTGILANVSVFLQCSSELVVAWVVFLWGVFVLQRSHTFYRPAAQFNCDNE